MTSYSHCVTKHNAILHERCFRNIGVNHSERSVRYIDLLVPI